MILTGTIIHNLGVANRTIPKQKPFFKAEIPEIERYRNGTINLLMHNTLGEVIKYDYYFNKLQWDKNKVNLQEDFGFIKIQKLIHKGEIFLNWGYMYFPMESPNRENKHLIELLGRNDPDIQVGDIVQIFIKDGYIKLLEKK